MESILSFIRHALPYCLVGLAVYTPLRRLWLKKRALPVNGSREVVLAVFAAYLIFLATETVLPEITVYLDAETGKWLLSTSLGGPRGVNLQPFHTIEAFLRWGGLVPMLINVLGNVVVFSPIGLFLPLLWERRWRWWKMLLLGGAVSLSIEVTQLFVGRSFDVDDIILNALGVLLGYWLYLIVRKGWKESLKRGQ